MTSSRPKLPAYQADVCICTFRRSHIVETLLSLAAMALPADFAFRVIVADNDDTPSARTMVEQTAVRTGLAVVYVHAPARNISIARNACLQTADAPLVAFIDDDELATPGWLAALAGAMDDDADVVLGPVKALYAPDCPEWIVRADLHSARPVWVDGAIRTGYTSNVLFRRTAPPFEGLSFRFELGRSGGEDTAFFTAAYEAGARIVFCAEAAVTEIVPADRATFKWLAKRRYRAGQTHGRLVYEAASGAGRTRALAQAAVKAVFCVAAGLMPARTPGHFRRCLIRGALHAGVISRLLGRPEIEQYGGANHAT